MSWLEKILPKTTKSSARKEIPEGVWAKCTDCDSILYKAELEKSLNVCPKCN
ncbi:acetyl-CoA carboxylase carboxyl transferase subunit beta, partial [Streptococcus suis]